jgi:eukaryotic-like serine/threonine-protein kinase
LGALTNTRDNRMSDSIESSKSDSLERDIWIDQLCDRFESAIKGGKRMTIPDFLRAEGLDPDSPHPHLLRELTRLEDAYPSAPLTGVATVERKPSTFGIPYVPGQVIADRYTLLEVIGEGGMGIVFRADQGPPVKRQVALKLIRSGLDSKTVLTRFDAERQALALMDHPNIAKVYDGGTTSTGQPFFVMELVKGLPITNYCDRERLSVRARLELFVLVCDAVQHAHQKGIIHRDLKPGNILVTELDGKAIPKVIDFGVAKAIDQKLTEESIIEFGAIVGTLVYMSPEQADPTAIDIDTRTDVYALGVVLYELLAGSTPLEVGQLKRGAFLEMLRMVREVDPAKPSTKVSTAIALPNIASNRSVEPAQLKRALKGDLDWIVMKSVEKDRTRRYETANSFAADVQRHLANQPVLAAPPSAAYQARKFVRRNRVPVLAASLVLLSLLGGIIGTAWQAYRAEKRVVERDEALIKRDDAVKAETERADELKYQLGVNNMVLANDAYANLNDASLATQRLLKVPKAQRNWGWDYLLRQSQGAIYTLRPPTSTRRRSTCAAVSPDGSRIVSMSETSDNKVGRSIVWDSRSGVPLFELDTASEKSLFSFFVCFTPDGRQIITGNGTIQFWNARGGELLRELKVDCLGFSMSRDGTKLLTGTFHDSSKLWDLRSGKLLHVIPGRVYNTSVFSPNSDRVVTGSPEDASDSYLARVSNSETGELLFELKSKDSSQEIRNCFATFSPDGRHIATGNRDGSAKLWDSKTGIMLLDFKGHTDEVTTLSFSPDGTLLATGSEDKSIRVWEVRTGKPLGKLIGHTDAVTSVTFTPDGMQIVSGSDDGTVKVWDGRFGVPVIELTGHRDCISCATFSRDSQRIATGSIDGTARIWDPKTGFCQMVLRGHSGQVKSITFDADASHVVTASDDGTVKVWKTSTGRNVADVKLTNRRIGSMSLCPDGKKIGLLEGDDFKICDLLTGRVLCRLRANHCSNFTFSPDGTQILSVAFDQMSIWDAKTGHLTRTIPLPLIADRVAWSNDGAQIIASGIYGTSALIVDAKTESSIFSVSAHGGKVRDISLSPDGNQVVTVTSQKILGPSDQVQIWDLKSETSLFELKGVIGSVNTVMFSPDGRMLFYADSSSTAKIWYAGLCDPESNQETIGLDSLPYRLKHTRPNSGRYQEGYESARKHKNRFAAGHFLDRILSIPEQRTLSRFRERNEFLADPMVIARTKFHLSTATETGKSIELEWDSNEPDDPLAFQFQSQRLVDMLNTTYDQPLIQFLASKGDRLALRLLAQQSLRDGKPKAAVPLLFAAMLARPVTVPLTPPVEELLLAQAYLDLNQLVDARRLYQVAASWLDRPAEPLRVANVVSHLAMNPWAGIGEIFAPLDDPRRNPFDWESWHEYDVFREVIEMRLAGKALAKPTPLEVAARNALRDKYLARANAREKEGKFLLAADDWEKLIELSPPEDAASANYHQGKLLIWGGRVNEGEEVLDRCMEIRQREVIAAGPDGRKAAWNLFIYYYDRAIIYEPQDRPANRHDKLADWFGRAIPLGEEFVKKWPGPEGQYFLRWAYQKRATTLGSMGRYSEAVLDWDRVLQLCPKEEVLELRVKRCLALSQSGRIKDCDSEITQLLKLSKWKPDHLRDFAFSYAGATLLDTDMSNYYSDKAMALLNQAVKEGYSNREDLAKSPFLVTDYWKSLRERDDFKALLKSMPDVKK